MKIYISQECRRRRDSVAILFDKISRNPLTFTWLALSRFFWSLVAAVAKLFATTPAAVAEKLIGMATKASVGRDREPSPLGQIICIDLISGRNMKTYARLYSAR